MKSNDVLKNGKDKYWYIKKLKQFNKTVFFLMNEKEHCKQPIEIVFENKLPNAS
ncbi:MAG: hypothetical protein AB7E37_06780 [Candidatus Altimarinota bacterium]